MIRGKGGQVLKSFLDLSGDLSVSSCLVRLVRKSYREVSVVAIRRGQKFIVKILAVSGVPFVPSRREPIGMEPVSGPGTILVGGRGICGCKIRHHVNIICIE